MYESGDQTINHPFLSSVPIPLSFFVTFLQFFILSLPYSISIYCSELDKHTWMRLWCVNKGPFSWFQYPWTQNFFLAFVVTSGSQLLGITICQMKVFIVFELIILCFNFTLFDLKNGVVSFRWISRRYAVLSGLKISFSWASTNPRNSSRLYIGL